MVHKVIKEMLELSAIELSISFNSPMLLVPKENGEWRAVVEYLALDKITVPHPHTLRDLLLSTI